jgi:Uma2 family endonuclease
MAMTLAIRQTSAERRTRLLPLENGDRLDAEEFLLRYEAMPEVKKAELVEEEVHMPSPVRADTHGEPHFDLMGWLYNYKMFTPGVRGGDNITVRLGRRDVLQPDALLYVPAESGGQARVGEDGYLAGAPELIAEVASSSVSIDLGRKLEAYRRHGVQEYLVWRVNDEAIDWNRLRGDAYVPLPVEAGVIKSEVFPGLWLNVSAMLVGDLKAVFATLQQGVATAEHAAFVRRLADPGQTP